MSFPKFVNMTKNTLSPQICKFFTPKRCTRVHCLVPKNNPNYVIFFSEDDIQLQIQVPPPPGFVVTPGLGCHSTHEHVCLWDCFNPTIWYYMCALSPLFILVPKPLDPYIVGLYNILVCKTSKKKKKKKKKKPGWLGPCRPMLMLWAMNRIYYCDSTRHHNVVTAQSFRTAAQVACNTNPQSIGALHVNKDQLLRT